MTAISGVWGNGQVIAHRGSRILWPENTMVAFARALELGADHLETDLRRTADGHLACFHDDTVERTTNGTGPVGAYTLAGLRELDAGFRHRVDGAYPFRGRGMRVPTLGEVLATFPEAGVVVDLKEDWLEAELTELLDRMDAWHRVIVGSFSDARLERMRRASEGRALVSAGPLAARRWWLASRLGRGGPGGMAALQVPPTSGGLRVVDRRLVEAAHARGVAVHVWTVNLPQEMGSLWSLGVDALITDRVDLAVGSPAEAG
ncbi:MAG: glycerophosphodiester phosphodiesterase [Actinomycetota bacterium]